MRTPRKTQQLYCYRCGTPMAANALSCSGCGAASLSIRTSVAPSAIFMSLGAVAIAVLAVYFLVIRGSSDGPASVAEDVTLEELALKSPPGWRSLFDAPDRYTFALTEKDLTASLPAGPRIVVTREEKASVNFPGEVTADIDEDDERDRIKNGGRYGAGGQLTGSEIRFLKKTEGEEDYIERHLYLRGGNVFGPAFDIVFLVPVDDEELYNEVFNDMLESLELLSGE